MPPLQKSVVIVLGELGPTIEEPLKQLIAARKLSDGLEYPSFLYDIITINYPIKANKKASTGSNPKGLVKSSADDDSITLADLKTTEQAVERQLLSSIKKVSHAQKINLLQTNRGIPVKPELYFYIITPVCDNCGRLLFYNVIKAIYKVCRSVIPMFQVQALLLMPSLFTIEEAAGDSTSLRNARAYAFLQELDHIMNKVPSHLWGESYPLQKIWLIDALNQEGNFVGTLDEVSWIVAETLTSIIVDNALEATGGTDDKQLQDRQGKGKFYNSFGLIQLLFPKDLLLEQLTNQVLQQVLSQLVSHKDVRREEIVVGTRLFVNQQLQADRLAERVCCDREGKALVTEFVPRTPKELDVKSFISELSHEAEAYEKGKELDENKLRIYERAKQLIQEKMACIGSEIDRLINTREKGLPYALAFTDELLGRGEQSPFMGGNIVEPQKNLLTVKRDYLTRMERLLGLEGEDLRARINEVEAKLAATSAALASYEEELEHVSQSPATQPWEKQIWEENVKNLKQQLEKLEQTKADLHKKLELLDQLWQREEIRQEAIRKAIEEKQEAIETQKRTLLTNQDEINKLDQDLLEIGERSRELLMHYFIYYPIALVLGIIAAAILVWWGTASGISSWWPLYLLPTLLTGLQLLPFMLIVNLVLAARSYRLEIAIPRDNKRKRIKELEQEIDSQKSDLREKYKAFFQTHLDIHVHERIIQDILPQLLRATEIAYQQGKSFLESCRKILQKASSGVITYPQSLTRMSVISSDDNEFFLSLLFPGGVESEIDRFLAERGGLLSDYVKEGTEGLRKLEQRVAEWVLGKFRSVIAPLSIENIIFDHYEHLTAVVPPRNWMAALQALTPFLRITVPAGDERVEFMYSIGVEEADHSRFRQAFTGVTEPAYWWSHYDNSMILAFCWTSNFSRSYIGWLNLYQEAYEQLRKQGTKGLHHPELQNEGFDGS